MIHTTRTFPLLRNSEWEIDSSATSALLPQTNTCRILWNAKDTNTRNVLHGENNRKLINHPLPRNCTESVQIRQDVNERISIAWCKTYKARSDGDENIEKLSQPMVVSDCRDNRRENLKEESKHWQIETTIFCTQQERLQRLRHFRCYSGLTSDTNNLQQNIPHFPGRCTGLYVQAELTPNIQLRTILYTVSVEKYCDKLKECLYPIMTKLMYWYRCITWNVWQVRTHVTNSMAPTNTHTCMRAHLERR